MYCKLYTLDNEFISESEIIPDNFTGIAEPYNGDKYWFLNGKYHRLDGPAIEYANGTKVWYCKNELHRLDGPAIEWADGTKEWWINDKLHRLYGPAIENVYGTQYYCINDEFFSKEQHKLYVDLLKLKGLI